MKGLRARDVVLVGAGVLLAVLVLRGPVGSLLPLLAVGGCLLMHVWMMGHMGHMGHGGHGAHERPAGEAEADRAAVGEAR